MSSQNLSSISIRDYDLSKRAPTPDDNASRGFAVGDLWRFKDKLFECKNVSASDASWVPLSFPNVRIGDIATSKISIVGGTIKCVSTYAGNAIDISVTISATPTEFSIGFIGNELDNDAVARAYALADTDTLITVTKIYDQSGSSNHLTQVSTNRMPKLVWSVEQDRYLISGDAAPSSGLLSGRLGNSSVAFTRNNSAMICIGGASNFATNAAFCMAIGSIANGKTNALHAFDPAQWGMWSEVVQLYSGENDLPTANATILGVTTANPCKFISGNKISSRAYPYTTDVLTGAYIYTNTSVNESEHSMRASAFIFYDSVPTDLEISLIQKATYLNTGAVPQKIKSLILVGDSRIMGFWGKNWSTIATSICDKLGAGVAVYSVGIGSIQQSQLLSGLYNNLEDLKVNGSAIVVDLSGVNDFIVGNLTASQALDQTKLIAAKVKASGMKFYKIAELSTGVTTNGADVKVPEYRALLLNDNAWADGVIDVSGNYFVGHPFDTMAYPDNLHPTEATQSIIADFIIKKLREYKEL